MNVVSVNILLPPLCRIIVPRRFFTRVNVLVDISVNIITVLYILIHIPKRTSLGKLAKHRVAER